jgi:hypothetical protein
MANHSDHKPGIWTGLNANTPGPNGSSIITD